MRGHSRKRSREHHGGRNHSLRTLERTTHARLERRWKLGMAAASVDEITQLRALGVRPGGVPLVHTPYREVRPVAGGPSGLIKALRTSLDPGECQSSCRFLLIPYEVARDSAPSMVS